MAANMTGVFLAGENLENLLELESGDRGTIL